jgi:hypothetical protein
MGKSLSDGNGPAMQKDDLFRSGIDRSSGTCHGNFFILTETGYQEIHP